MKRNSEVDDDADSSGVDFSRLYFSHEQIDHEINVEWIKFNTLL